MNRIRLVSLAVLLAALHSQFLVGFGHPARLSGSTVQVENLGTPFTTGLYARNVWDMQFYDGRIYLGHGNSSNSGPDTNAGPIPIWSYDLARNAFVQEFTTHEEQVDIFRVLDGRLYTPGHDPREGSQFGNYYRLDPEGWQKIRTIPEVIHTYDLALHEGKLFAANGTLVNNTVTASSDGGEHWDVSIALSGRTYELFQFKGSLYAMQWIFANNAPAETHLYRYDNGAFDKINVAGALLVPGWPRNTYARMVRTTEFREQLIYIGSEYGVNDHQWDPLGLYVSETLQTARKVSLPEAGALPYDIIIRGDTLYLLAALRQANNLYVNLVYSSTDVSAWTELFRFEAATFARSFEEAGGQFYFGLGTNTSPVSPATGTILRVTLEQAPPSPTTTRTATATITQTAPPTATRSPTATATAEWTATATPTTTVTSTSTSTVTTSATATATSTTPVVPTNTSTTTASVTPTLTLTPSPTPSTTPTAGATRTATPSHTATPSSSVTTTAEAATATVEPEEPAYLLFLPLLICKH